jgi:hypothetical protein
MADLVQSMKKAALEAVDASKPAGVVFGYVLDINPLQIVVEQRMTLGPEQLIVCQHLTDYEVAVEVNWSSTSSLGGEDNELKVTGNTGSADGHSHSGASLVIEPSKLGHRHSQQGIKTMIIKNALQPGDQVVLFRMQGGQRFVVMDRMVAA